MKNKNIKPYSERFLEIDAARGASVISMVLYHSYVIPQYPYAQQPLREVAIIIASSFIFLSGLSIKIAYERGYRFPKFLIRSIKIGICALIITIATYLYVPTQYVIFGILHFISVASLLIYPLLKRGILHRGVLALAILIIFILTPNKAIGNIFTIPIGFYPKSFHSLDYFPIIPWITVMLLGTIFSDIIYPQGERKYKIKLKESFITKILVKLGRKSLWIYMGHIPLIYCVTLLIRSL